MIFTFAVFVVLVFAFLHWKRAFRRVTLIFLAIAICATSFFIACVSVSSVWVPHPLSDDVSRDQNVLGQYEGMFPWSKLSYPFYLNVYHTPFYEQTRIGRYSHGEAHFDILVVNVRIIEVNSTFSYYIVMGPAPLDYVIDFPLHDSPEFFGFLLVLFASFNIVGGLLGTALAKALQEKVKK